MGRYPPGGEELGRFLGMCVSGVPLFSYGPRIKEIVDYESCGAKVKRGELILVFTRN